MQQGFSVMEDEQIPAAITDPGLERELNEDRYAVIESPSGVAWFVCDGVGGVAGGELASQLAIDAIKRDLEQHPKRNADQALKAALEEANRVVVLRRQNLSFGQMGTTVVAAMFSGREVIIGNVGDSRAYLVRGGAIQQLTTDHTFVQELVERGQILHEDAMAHPQAHVLTRCIGAEPGLKVDISKYWIWRGAHQDKLVLCSDGLYSLVSDDEIGKAISDLTPQKACVHLVELAKSRGGYDNITISVVPLGGELRDEPAPDYYEPRQSKGQRNKQVNLMLVVGLSCFAIVAVGVFILQVLSN